MGLYDDVTACHPALQAGAVYCPTCERAQTVESASCLRDGWPTCCGATMRLGAPPWRQRDALAALLYAHVLGWPPWEERTADEPIVGHYKRLAATVLRWLEAAGTEG